MFEQIETTPRTKAGPTASISYRRTIGEKRKTKDKRPMLVISLPVALAHGMKVGKESRWILQIGKDTDAGKARVSKVPPDSKLSTAIPPVLFKHTYVFRFGYVPMLGDDAAEQEDCESRVIDASNFEIDLPAWFKPALDDLPNPVKKRAAA